jgi:Mce-associated membrane protein
MSSDESADTTVAEPEEAEQAPEATEAVESEPQPPSQLPRWVLLGSAAFALAALIAAAVFGIQWWVSSSDDNASLATAREDVIRAGGSAIKAYTEVDYNDLDGFFARQKAASDPSMADQLTQAEPSFRKAIQDAKTQVSTTIQDIAVEELNDHEGKASFLAAISTKVTQGAQSSVKSLRLEVQMSRVDDNGKQVWKLSGIGDVPLVAAGQ